ncbi:kelch repeat-containing protein [Lutibacter sp. TH_r2]|uniref:Kelch repeat-containing protein n=1 Tax=Lutibacter sp. TH_r2 TaxID=3082083 RepID=UPI0029529CFA|nr:kelch repeat-containing protein [Lutibacter sp. TH_r2]MDV7186118.1 kelch repeat-containing protein [Lutibacter sp. TH_r2]
MKFRNVLLKFIPVLLIGIVVGCSDDDTEYGNWVESSSFDGDARANSVSFVIGDKGYLVAGYDGDDYLSDVWEYDKDGDYWVQKADFPGIARSGAVGFSIDNIGYFGTGYDGDDKLKDFWSFDPNANTWEQKADFAGSERYGAVGFSLVGMGYIGTGYDGSELKDFYQYNPSTDEWVQSVGFGGDKRKDATVFTIGDLAYMGTGLHNGAYENDFYVFDGVNETWTRLKDLDDDDEDYSILLSNGVGFSLNGMGYITTGGAGGVNTNVWEYNPATDTWDDLPDYEGSARQDAIAFNFSDKAFVLMGKSGSYYFDDNWEFRPEEEENEDD